MAALIETRELSKIYRVGEIEIPALRAVNLTIEQGEFVAVMGASGSGKTTLMNILGCLDRPTSGTFLLQGIDVTTMDEAQLADIRSRHIGFVFQNFNLLPRTTALENVELPLVYSGFTEAGYARAVALLKAVGLADRIQNQPNQLSGGQQQRVAIARALVNEPVIVFADEPTGNLDSKSSAEILDILRRLNREQGLTVVVVTHDPEVGQHADRIVSFRDGEVVSDERKAGLAPPSASGFAGQGGHLHAASEAGSILGFGVMALSAAARSVERNMMRALLTMLGIFIGVAAVIATVAVGAGAAASVQAQIESLGTNLLIVLPGAVTSNGVRGGFGSSSTLTLADTQALAKEMATAEVAYTIHQVGQVEYGNQNWSTSIQGSSANYLDVRDWPMAEGREFTVSEDNSAAPVCLLGQTVMSSLFAPGADPVGKIIRVRNFPLRVIGVLSAKGQSTYGQDQDDLVVIPFNTAERKVLGVGEPTAISAATASPGVLNPYAAVPNPQAIYSSTSSIVSPFGSPPKIAGVVQWIMVKMPSAAEVAPAQDEVTAILHHQHHIRPGQDDDFDVRDLNEVAQTSARAAQVMTLLLGAVASISLLVGGIGIMNIMLVSVTERTREIGIRMAIGARRRHILLQFLVEAIFVSVLGGLAGIILGVGVSKLISALADWPTLVSPSAVVGGFVFSAAVGVFFGFYPARKAAMLDPIESLRYE